MRSPRVSMFGRNRGGAAAGLAAVVVIALWAGSGFISLRGQALQHAVSVTLKLVQVYATGKGGAPVTDLTAADFEVTDNGKVQPVTHFEKHALDVRDAPGATNPALSTNRKFFLIFDFAFMDARGIFKAKSAGLKFLSDEALPTDEIGLITYSMFRGLVIHEYLTTDHERIRRLVDTFGVRQHPGRAEDLTDFVYQAELAEEKRAPDESGGIDNEDDFFLNQGRLQTGQRVDEGRRQSYIEQAREMIRALNFLARGLRLVAGFKNIILFSGGIAHQALYGKVGGSVVGEWTTPEQLVQQLSDYDAAQADSALRGEFTALLKDFNSANCPVYSVDVSRAQHEADPAVAGGAGLAYREIKGSDSLRQLASETGGRYFANTMEEERIAAEIQSDTGTYYVLGYSVDEKWDGKFHRIKVKVKRKGVDVHAQGGYFNPKPFEDYTKFEKLLHVVDVALSEVPDFQVPYEVPVAALPIRVKGWPQLLVFGRASRDVHAEVLGKKTEAYLILLDEKGDVADIKRSALAVPEAGAETVYPSFLVAVKPGAYDCRLVVRNLVTGRAARGAVPAVVTPQGSSAMTLDPPLLLGPSAGALVLATPPEGSPAALFGYEAGVYAPLIEDVPAETTKIRAALRLGGLPPGGEVELTAALVDATTRARSEVPVTIVKQRDDAGIRLYLLELTMLPIKPGDYVFEFAAAEPGAGTAAVASRAFTAR